ncbi:MAG: porin family protein [candidate division Zixibacteria bacterium]|nr:porin family protein [candidate division Zixibacteria bacterium]
MTKRLICFFFVVATVLVSGAARAQSDARGPVDKGSLMLDGSAFFASQSGDLYEDYGLDDDSSSGGDNRTTISVMPMIAYFVAPGLMVGSEFRFTRQSLGTEKDTYFGFGPTAGYFFNLKPVRTDARGLVYPYLKAFISYGKQKREREDSSTEGTFMSFGGQAGLVYMLSNTVGADLGARYSLDTMDPESENAESLDGTTLQVGIGITAFIY